MTFEEVDRKHFAKMYPDINYEGKYILWVNIDLFWPFTHERVECKLHVPGLLDHDPKTKQVLSSQGLIQSFTTLAPRHLYPNKLYYTACMKNGRKKCDQGFVLYFDTFSDLQKAAKHLAVTWVIRKTFDNNTEDYSIQSNYDLSFEEDPEKKVYTLNDVVKTIYLTAEAREEFDKFLDKYESVYVQSGDKEAFAKDGISKDTFFSWILAGGHTKSAELYSQTKTLLPHTRKLIYAEDILAAEKNQKTS